MVETMHALRGRKPDMPLNERVAAEIGALIARGTYRPGERIPSIRGLCRKLGVSVNTVIEAYAQLENRRVVEARPRSGYYVACPLAEPEDPFVVQGEKRGLAATKVEIGKRPLEIMRTLGDPRLVPLGGGVPNPELLPMDRLSRMLATEARRFRTESITYSGAKGLKRLRLQIARRALDAGCRLAPDDIVVTSGCVEAVTLALQAICRPGDTVAIGSPVYYTFLNAIQWLRLRVLEIPSTPRDGLSLEALASALRRTRVSACIAIANFNNPLGSTMSDGHKQELVHLLARHDVPLVEDDVYGDLCFGSQRPRAAKAFDEKGLVLYCSSFSKTLAPGYRVGWIAAGRFQNDVQRLKSLFNLATASPTQLAIAEFLTSGGYDRHLRVMRRTYARQVMQLRAAVARWFPRGTRATSPEGGFVVWVELPPQVDTLALYAQALEHGVAIAPGTLFTAAERYRNCMRLSAAFWSERIEAALRTVGELASQQAPHGISSRGRYRRDPPPSANG